MQLQPYTKAIIALAGVILPLLEQIGIPLPEFLTLDWVQTVVLTLTPIAVWFFPNKDSNGGNLSVTRSPATISALVLILAMLTLAGCESIGVPKAETFNDRIGYALGTHTAVLRSTTSGLNLGEITVEEATDIAEIADRARSIIDSSRVIHDAGDIPGANRQLTLAILLLQELQTYLRGEQP